MKIFPSHIYVKLWRGQYGHYKTSNWTICFKMEKEPPVRFAWLNIGSQGRKEQLLLTDQDNALVKM
jgi:hypothetical protein